MYLGLSILELSRILMYGFWYDYKKPLPKEKNKKVIGLIKDALGGKS